MVVGDVISIRSQVMEDMYLNLPINSCPLDTALVLTSDNFHSIFCPSPFLPHLLLLQPLGNTFQKLSCDTIFTVFSHTFTLF
jgi:hypothetical protein